MTFRTSYLVGLMATVLAVSSTTYFVHPAVAADTPNAKPLKIMGTNGTIGQVNYQYGPTTSKDTFWSIAQKVRPDLNVSVYQVMAAVFDANPHAFNSDNYNSLERGMILLIPSKEVMLSIPNSLAIARAERSEKEARSRAKAVKRAVKVVKSQPSTVTAPLIAEVKPKTEVKPEVNESQVVATQTVPKTDSKVVNSDINARLEAAERKNLSLTDELARTQDQLSVRDTDVEALKAKVEELNQQIAVLEETLQATKQQNQSQKEVVEVVQSPVVAKSDRPKEVNDLWRTLVESPQLLVAVAVIPVLLILLLVFWVLGRKSNKERRELETQQAAMAVGATAVAAHLDTGSISVQPEQDMNDSPEQMDITSDTFIDQGASVAGEQTKSSNILEEEDLTLLAGLGLEEEQAHLSNLNTDNPSAVLDDTDPLLVSFDAPEVREEEPDVSAEIAAELNADLGEVDIEEPVDIDITMAKTSNAVEQDIQASLPEDLLTAEDELDVVLAEFDLPEQGDANADDFNFHMETAQEKTEKPTDEDELLKGIGAVHAVDGTDDSFELAPTIDVSALDNIDTVVTKFSPIELLKVKESKTDLTSVEDALNYAVDLKDDLNLNTDVGLSDDNTLAEDEVLTELDAQGASKLNSFVTDHDLTSFSNEHGYIEIDKLLNDAEQDPLDPDQYPDVDLDMSNVGSLIGDAAMIDVDDEENLVNAKLDLARAYIEIDDSDSAKALLKEVQIDGNERQQDEAARLLKNMA